jgi:ATP-dependent protease ClpP protease subunit
MVYLYLQSPGGSVFAGMKAVSYIRSTPKKIVCIVDVAISMAAVILSVCDERVSTSNSIYMQHVTSYSIPQMAAPNAESFQKFLARSAYLMDIAQAARIGISYQAFKSLTRNDWWLMGEDLVTQRVADRATQVTCTRKAISSVIEETFNTPFGSLLVSWSACPLISAPQSVKAASFYGTFEKREELIRKLNVRDSLLTPYSVSKEPAVSNKP